VAARQQVGDDESTDLSGSAEDGDLHVNTPVSMRSLAAGGSPPGSRIAHYLLIVSQGTKCRCARGCECRGER
jgi:hypothetical protein